MLTVNQSGDKNQNMIAKLLIANSLDDIRKEIDHQLHSHLGSGDTNHPDVLLFPHDSKLGVEQAKKIKEHFSLKPYSAKGRVGILEDGLTLTVEAQNALLKTIEELPTNALFIMGTPSESKLLPTILSRCEIIHLKNPTSHHFPTSEAGYEKDIEKLLNSTIEQRFEYIEKLKDKEGFLHSLMLFFHKLLQTKYTNSYPIGHKTVSDSETLRVFLKELLQVEEWAKHNVNIRAILEYLMLKMPIT